MVKLLIFDMDGTLIDTDQVLYETWKELFLLYKPKDYVIDREFVRGFSGPPIEESIAKAFPEMDRYFIEKEYRQRAPKYYDLYLDVYPNELEILKKIHDEGYILAISTSKNREMAIKSLKKYNIESYFDYIITSSDGFKTKPSPDALLYIIQKTGVSKDETLMIGDTKFDYLAAKNAGVDCLLFNGSPRYYDEETKPIKVCSDYKEIYNFIKNKK